MKKTNGMTRGRTALRPHRGVLVLVWLGVVLFPAWRGHALTAQDSTSLQYRLVVTEAWRVHGATLLDGLTSVTGLAETEPGAIWVSDMSGGRGRVLKFDPSQPAGMTVVGSYGEGPGEVWGPGRMAVADDGSVAVHDLGRAGVEVYAPSGESLQRVRFPVRVTWSKGFDVLPFGGFVVSGSVAGIAGAVHQFDHEGRLVRSWGDQAQADNWRAGLMATGGTVHALSDGSVLYSQGAPHRIVRYEIPASGTGEVGERPVAALDGLLGDPGDAVIVERVEDGVPIRGFNVSYPQSRGVWLTEDEFVLNVVVSKEDGESIWQLFEENEGSPEGDARLVGETRVSEAYSPWFRCRNGDILASLTDPVTDIPILVRLELAIEPMELPLGGSPLAPIPLSAACNCTSRVENW